MYVYVCIRKSVHAAGRSLTYLLPTPKKGKAESYNSVLAALCLMTSLRSASESILHELSECLGIQFLQVLHDLLPDDVWLSTRTNYETLRPPGS